MMIKLKRRLFITLLCIVFGLSALIGRLFWIQTVDSPSFSGREVDLTRRSVIQREKGIELDSGRGDFYDRHMNPITGDWIEVLTVFPVKDADQKDRQNMLRMAKILNVSFDQWMAFMDGLKEPGIWSPPGKKQPVRLSVQQAAAISSLRIPGIKVMTYRLRYPEHFAARHVIGFIGQDPKKIEEHFADGLNKGYLTLQSQIGASGLEKTFERFLQGIGGTSISYFTDAKHRSLPGLDTRWVKPTNPFYPLKAITTIDLPVQKKIEAYLDKTRFPKGAVVVLDVKNADVLAMASRPDFDPHHIDLHQGHWNNKALKAAVPGSVFKTVVAAAALEEKVVSPDEVFECTGALGKYGFTCWLKEGHGKITFREAFAVSCNITFAKVIQRLDADLLEKYAHRLGLGHKVGWTGTAAPGGGVLRQWDGEDTGQLFASATLRQDAGVLVQTSIGQRDVRMTPLQAANMVVALLNQGELLSPRAVKEIRYQNGQLMLSFPELKLSGESPISKETALLLSDWMEEVVTRGTGKALQKAKWELAGKSGTAEVAPGMVNQWFVGYGPSNDPRYAVAVMVENVPDHSNNFAIEAFRDVMDILASE
jgi:cell division protein FtsI/penicillin-binding protein 2